MKKLKDALARLAEKLGMNKARLAWNYRRWKKRNHQAEKWHKDSDRAKREADRLRRQGKPKQAAKADHRSINSQHRADKYRAQAVSRVGKIKVLKRKIEHLDKSQAEKELELAKWLKTHKVSIDGDTVTGGTPRQRLVAAALAAAAGCSSGKRPNFYSQSGTYAVTNAITGDPYGYRSDCSQFVTSVYHSAGLEDPNAYRWTGGYTGTLVANGKQVNNPQPGDLVLYGSGTAHHVEMYVGPGDKTIGHGSAPVDAGVINLFGDGDYRFFSYL